MSKEMWFAEMERLLGEYEGQGMSFEKAYARASDEAADALRERLADTADFERKRRRELRSLMSKLDPSVDNIDPEGNEQ